MFLRLKGGAFVTKWYVARFNRELQNKTGALKTALRRSSGPLAALGLNLEASTFPGSHQRRWAYWSG